MNVFDFQLVGYGMVCGGLLIYLCLYFAHESSFIGLRSKDVLYNLVSHVSDDERSAGLHIISGVLFTCGIALVVGGAVITIPFVLSNATNVGVFLTASGLVFGVEISMLSFWTLWQTRRIEQNQGAEISSFHGLIQCISEEMDRLLDDLRARKFNSTPLHRIYILTTNPFFGHLSFPTEKYTIAFEDSLRTASKWVSECRRVGPGNGSEFDFQILCGDETALNEFHRVFFGTPDQPAAVGNAEVAQATKAVEDLLSELATKAGTSEIIHRIKRVPRIQFAVVGNTVFEFALENPGFQSEIRAARRIREKVMCDRFVETFQVMKGLP
jgi:hypothetical protein